MTSVSAKFQFSANLGFLFTEYSLPDAVHAAHQAGFTAVECHWPYEVPPEALATALDETGLPLLSLNSAKGDTMGLCAQHDDRALAKQAIDEAFAYAQATGARAIHLMAGIATGTQAEACFFDNLAYALDKAEIFDKMILIEALNQHDAPGYFLTSNAHASDIITRFANPRLKLLFDCYHVVLSGGDILSEFQSYQPLIGHIQFAGTPSRGRPDEGDTDYQALFQQFTKAGWQGPFGAEYRPKGATTDSLGWLSSYVT